MSGQASEIGSLHRFGYRARRNDDTSAGKFSLWTHVQRAVRTILLALTTVGLGVGSGVSSFAAEGDNSGDTTEAASRFEKAEITPRFVTIESLRVHYIETGHGNAVVMIHGNAGAVDDFEFGVFKALSRDYRVIAFDRPGHGKSDRPGGKAATVEYQAQLLHETLLRLGISQPVLAGHSWGCALALAYALKYPTETSGLVLLAPAAYPGDDANGLLQAVVKTPLIGDVGLLLGRSIMGRSVLKRDLERAFYPQPVPDDYFKIATSTWLGRKQLRAYLEDEWALNSSLKKISKRYAEIKLPVVIVTGDNDKIVSAQDNAYRLKAAIPQSKLIELKDTGHEIPVTRPESVYAALTLIARS